MTTTERFESALPPIALTAHDVEQLDRLANAAARRNPLTAEFLAREIARADILADAGERPDLVVMGSQVLFRDDDGGTRWVTLVYPQDADMAAGRVSVLTPIGTALIGLSVGQSIAFATPAGGDRSLTVLDVRHACAQAMP